MPGFAGRRVPEQRVLRRRVVELLEPLCGGLVALVLAPDPLGPGGEAFVQPDVGPLRQRHRVAEPHVRDLVHERRFVGDVREVRLRLRLERVADDLGGVDDRADGVERVRAVDRGVEVDGLRQLREHLALRAAGGRRRRRRAARPPSSTPSGRTSRASTSRGTVAIGSRLLPDPGRPAPARRRRDEDAVRHRGQACRDGDCEVERRLVARVVVAPGTSPAIPGARRRRRRRRRWEPSPRSTRRGR